MASHTPQARQVTVSNYTNGGTLRLVAYIRLTAFLNDFATSAYSNLGTTGLRNISSSSCCVLHIVHITVQLLVGSGLFPGCAVRVSFKNLAEDLSNAHEPLHRPASTYLYLVNLQLALCLLRRNCPQRFLDGMLVSPMRSEFSMDFDVVD